MICSQPFRRMSRVFSFFLLASSACSFLTGCAGGSKAVAPSQSDSNPAPSVASVSPSTIVAGGKGTTLTINGSDFLPSSVVQWNESARPTTYVNSGQLTVALTAADTSTAGSAEVNVVNPSPGGGSSADVSIIILVGVPAITGLSPDSILMGSANTVVTVSGVGFVPKSVVTVNGTPRATTFVSPTQLQFTLTASDLALSGFEQISVANPGGYRASPFELTILYPAPVLTSISPSAVSGTAPEQVLTVSGSSFTIASVVAFNGTPQPTTFVNSTTLTAVVNLSNPALIGNVQVTVETPPPGGGMTRAATLSIQYPVPSLTSISPASMPAGSGATQVTLQGTGLTAASSVQVNGSDASGVSTVIFYPYGGISLVFTLPAADFASVGNITITASNPGTAASNVLTLSVIPNPVPAVSALFPACAALGSSDLTITVNGQNFVPSSVVQWNGAPRSTTYTNSSQLSVVITAQDLQTLGNNNVTVSNPAPGGGESSSQVFTTYLALRANALIYNPVSQLLYAATPSATGPQLGNSVVSIDPTTGVLGTPIFVGSEPNELALSSDGTTLWVGLQGAGAVREVNLTTQTAGLQFSLGGGAGIYSPPSTATALAVVPGQDNSVAVAFTNGFNSKTDLAIYDSGVARPGTEPGNLGAALGTGAIEFDPTGTMLYQVGEGFGYATVGRTGVTQITPLNTTVNTSGLTDLRIDNGFAYLSNGIILNVTTGDQAGQFSVAPGQAAIGPVVPDSTIGKGFVLINPNYSGSYQIKVYDLATLDLDGSIAVSGVNSFSPVISPSTFQRWGQNGLAFSTGSQIYILQSPLVRDLSSSLADLSVTGSAPGASTTGTNLTFTLTVANAGPVTASPVTLVDDIPDGSAFVSTTTSQGSCSGASVIYCDLGSLASGSSATVQVTVTALDAGSLSNTAIVSAPQGDPNPANNVAVTNSTATGSAYNTSPVLSSISPEFVQAGSATFTLTVNGSGFSPSSTVQLNSLSLPTSFVSSTQLTATVSASNVANLGWWWIYVTTPTPGGGTSESVPLTVYQVLSLDSNRMHYDPFSQKLYFSVPSTATQVSGNSIVSVDPYAGTIGTPLYVGSEPNRIAETGDGNYLYVGLDGAESLTSVNLTNFTKGAVYPLVLPNSQTQTTASDLAVAPGDDNLLAIDSSGEIGLFDVSGSTGAFRPTLTTSESSNLAFWNDSYLFSFDNYDSGAEFYRWQVTSTGLSLVDNTGYTFNGLGGFVGGFELLNSIVYGFAGGVVNPIPTPPLQLGQFMISSAQGPPQTIGGTSVAAYPAAGRVFFLGETLAGFANPVLLSYDINRYVLVDAPTFVGSPEGVDLVRWGRDGLAWHSSTNQAFGSATPGSGQVFLVRGPFVLPQWGVQNPVPSLSSASPSTIAVGSGSLTLVIYGSNFVPGVVLTWNGAHRETTFISSSELTVAIPASDVSSAASVAVAANNPGTVNSNQLTITIQ